MKKKLLKSASVIALSAVMTCGAAATFAGCGGGGTGNGGGNTTSVSVSMFCSDNDRAMNEQNCNDWAAEYTKKLQADGTFTEDQKIKIVFSYQSDPTTYFNELARLVASNSQPDVFYVSPKYVKAWSSANKILDISDALAADSENLTGEKGIWEDALALYGYSKDSKYTSGDRITFNAATNKFETVKDGVEVGIYGLPKDYSNFGLGFNEVFFTDEVRTALTTKKTTDRTGTHGAEYLSADQTYRAERNVVTVDGKDAPLVNIGVPTFYKPYNFYRFANYDQAVAGGDPMANAVEQFTGGEGYCVTIPGWPGDTFKDAAKYWNLSESEVAIDETMQDPDATYDTSKGYITYTYAEFSALMWAMTYYINTYDWQGNGCGGAKTANGIKNVYGSDQYDAVLYVLPWLAGNDAQYSNNSSTSALNPTKDGQAIQPYEVGDATFTTSHRQLNGENVDIEIQYGINSERYIEAVGAFHAFGSDWNGNSNNAGDTTETKLSGFDLFAAGNCLFYGVGTWDASTLNWTSRDYLRYRLMPTPVSESHALYSLVKGADYQYGEKVKGSEYGAYKASYTGEEIMANQLERQDKWGARMDSVGYGVSSLVATQGWKKDAAIELVKWLTINPETQITLTYSGAQLPNFKYQCNDYYNNEGEFKKMVTPDKPEEFNATYKVAQEMYAASAQSATKEMTIQKWLEENYNDYVTGEKFNPYYANDKLSTLANLGYAMRALYLVSYTKADRDLSLRMQYGLNAARDAAMYTYTDAWITVLDPRGSGALMAYNQQQPYEKMGDILSSILYAKDVTGAATPIAGKSYATPAWWCLKNAAVSEQELQKAIQEEKNLLG